MGKKSTPAAPAAPDPVAVANAQAAANTTAATTQAELNRINQYTPQGSLVYSVTGNNPDGTPIYSQTQTYSPEQQALYNQQNQIAQSLGGLAESNISRVAAAQKTPFNFNGMTPLQTGVNGAGSINYGTPPSGQLQYGVNAGQLQDQIAPGGDVQKNLNFGGRFNPGDFNDTAKAAANSVYAQAASRLDPQFSQQEGDIRARLANSGISENSDAYRREMDNFNRDKTDAYNQANYSSIGAGLSAQQQGYSQQLGTRQQNTGEISTAGNFANDAQGQIFGQNAQQLQAFNTAQGQRFDQGQSNASLNNTAQGQQFQQGQSAAAFNNTAQNQAYNQELSGAQLNNNARQQQIYEATYLRNLPLNDIAALMGTGGGVQNPQFNQFAQVGVAAPDYQGAVYNSYNAQNQQYLQAQQNRSAGLGSIFGALGSIGAAFI